MSLVNQMLQDLEHRRTAEASVSPLGGLSASGGAVLKQPINYLLLSATIVMALVVVSVLIYLTSLETPMTTGFTSERVNKLDHEVVAPVDVIMPIAAEASAAKKLTSAKPLATEAADIKTPATNNQPLIVNSVRPASKKIVKKAPQAIEINKASVVVEQEPLKKSVVDEVSVASMSVVETMANVDAAVPAIAATNVQKANSVESVSKKIRPLTNEQQAKIAFQHAVKLLGRGDEVAAHKSLEKALTFEPAHVRSRETLAALLLNMGRVSEAASHLSEGLRLQPNSPSLARLYARILVDQGDNAMAVAVLEKADPSIRDDPEYYALLAVLYRGVQKHAQAALVYEQILKVRPGVAAWWMGLALSQEAMNESEKALGSYQRAYRAGGLSREVSQYVQSRIAALTVSIADEVLRRANEDSDGVEG